MLSFFLRAIRWRYLIYLLKKIRIGALFSATMMGFAANHLLPARAGEFIRAYYIGKREGISKSASFATIVIERVFDGFMLLLFLALALSLAHFPSWVKNMGYFAFGFFVVVLALLLSLKFLPSFANHFLSLLLNFLPHRFKEWAEYRIKAFFEGLHVLSSPSLTLASLTISVFVWLTASAVFYFTLLAFEINLPFWVSMFLTAFVGIGLMIPSAPGYVGTFHFLCTTGLGFFGIEKSCALALSIVLHGYQSIIIVAAGLVCMWVHHLPLRTLTTLSR
jgi:hypothetical protein